MESEREYERMREKIHGPAFIGGNPINATYYTNTIHQVKNTDVVERMETTDVAKCETI